MVIKQLNKEYFDYVVNVVINRWEISREEAIEEVTRWLNNIDNTICFVGIIDNKPIATGVFETYSTVDESIPCWNTLLWVEPECRGNNYGKQLTNERFLYARRLGYKEIYLDTVNAKNYHLKHGWKIIKEFKKDNEYYTIMRYEFLN